MKWRLSATLPMQMSIFMVYCIILVAAAPLDLPCFFALK